MQTQNAYSNGSSYLRSVLTQLPEVRDWALSRLSSIKYDTLVGTGISGNILVPTLALEAKKEFAIVRKEIDLKEWNYKPGIEGIIKHRWVLVDDLISSGTTLERVCHVVKTLAPDAEFVGALLYNQHEFRDARLLKAGGFKTCQ